MTMPKIKVLPTKLAGDLAARGRHRDGRKVWFTPTRKSGKLVLRGMGYAATETTKKVHAFPTKVDGKLEFRSVTAGSQAGCINQCWACDPGPVNLVDDPIPKTSIDVLFDNWPGGAGCCQQEFGGIRYNLAACVYPQIEGGTCTDPDVGDCPIPTGLISPAQWQGAWGGYYDECDNLHPGDLAWELKITLRTWCREDMTPEEYYATLNVSLDTHDSSHGTIKSSCCLNLQDAPPAEGEGRCRTWLACWQIAAYELCGNFGSHTPPLCCCYDYGYPCECMDFYLLEPE